MENPVGHTTVEEADVGEYYWNLSAAAAVSGILITSERQNMSWWPLVIVIGRSVVPSVKFQKYFECPKFCKR